MWRRVVVRAVLLALFLLCLLTYSRAHIEGMQHTEWLTQLLNRYGNNCCSMADAVQLDDDKWRCRSPDYNDCSVKLFTAPNWMSVDPAKIVDPKQNKTGFAYVWYYDSPSGPVVKCFLPGVPQT